MNEKFNRAPAFPIIGTHEQVLEVGMHLRDYFAAKALQGICASGPSSSFTNDRLAAEAYALADAMLKERNKGKQA